MACLLQSTTLLFIFSITLILIPNRHAISFIVLDTLFPSLYYTCIAIEKKKRYKGEKEEEIILLFFLLCAKILTAKNRVEVCQRILKSFMRQLV
ncbi:uncharacterized protein LOC108467640 isoform X2 [Gossypium arboreum]|uniref:uncharacterized protein LOC108467640 isoform X2 n=1 Tax=Gossypium arboreum TaxID=29729 RepID=UPI0022F1D413|nr:uncharacterized protein LOC108467640 isoform X2 [Gossypium arboreum]